MRGKPATFPGELKRFAGGAAKQRALTFAREVSGKVVYRWDFACQGILGAFIVLRADAALPGGVTEINE